MPEEVQVEFFGGPWNRLCRIAEPGTVFEDIVKAPNKKKGGPVTIYDRVKTLDSFDKQGRKILANSTILGDPSASPRTRYIAYIVRKSKRQRQTEHEV